MDDFRMLNKYKNFLISAHSFKKQEDFSDLFEIQQISSIIPRAKHLMNIFKLRTLNVRLCVFRNVHFLFSFILTSIHRCRNIFQDLKVLMTDIKTETFNVGFTSK